MKLPPISALSAVLTLAVSVTSALFSTLINVRSCVALSSMALALPPLTFPRTVLLAIFCILPRVTASFAMLPVTMVVSAILAEVTASSAIISVATCTSPIAPAVAAPKSLLFVVVCCIFANVTASSAILSVVTFPLTILAVTTASDANLAAVTASSAKLLVPRLAMSFVVASVLALLPTLGKDISPVFPAFKTVPLVFILSVSALVAIAENALSV